MNTPLDDAEYLIRSENRIAILELLAEEARERRDIQEAIGISWATMARVFGELVDRGGSNAGVPSSTPRRSVASSSRTSTNSCGRSPRSRSSVTSGSTSRSMSSTSTSGDSPTPRLPPRAGRTPWSRRLPRTGACRLSRVESGQVEFTVPTLASGVTGGVVSLHRQLD
jgi:hypothetical protein